jgi:hypothetical protein
LNSGAADTASANAGQDVGTLNEWCLLPTTAPAAPLIEIGPASLSSGQLVNSQVVETLTISNTGTADLDWDIFEDGSSLQSSLQASSVAICDAPDDISWLTVSPTSGTASAASADSINVTFDSTGLATGIYSGTLCVNSNDSTNPLVQVPLEMTVTDIEIFLPFLVKND